MSIKTKFYFILLGFGLAVVLSTISSYFVINLITAEYDSTMNNVKVNGVYYKKIVMAKDLIADILPPPMYIVESYLLCNLMYSEKNPSKLDKLIKKSYTLKEEYITRENVWIKDLPDGDMKNYLLNNSKDAAYSFFKVRDEEFIPALKAGDYIRANRILLTDLNTKFEEHKQFIETVVAYANKFATNNEKESKEYQSQSAVFIKDMISQNNLLLISVNLVILIILSYITLKIIAKFIKNLSSATTRLVNISEGNF